MGPAVVITAVRRSRSHLKKKRRYQTVQLQEYQGSRQNRPTPQMVSVDLDSTVFFPLIFSRVRNIARTGAVRRLLGAPILNDRIARREMWRRAVRLGHGGLFCDPKTEFHRNSLGGPVFVNIHPHREAGVQAG
ncbi:hypothetical protein ALC57_07936 [Trachymyrmex cornetzi]|uniref:Uncharacterized protein n=1 Tax=Trachymyrmex cornetzi TaxID=471704 RepID=A0A151J7G4_9HYME|nr:hypothetical protein ALC57_07936 [Trachymyrmex cornetzi]